MSKLTLLAAGAAGYVLGARAGRQRYDQIAQTARSVMGNPKVQAARQQAQDVAAEQAANLGEKAKETASTFASTAADKVRRDEGAHAGTTTP
ncbi:hypothetical protein [Nocardioides taihuensis]|uniref:YtxH domain-containing protein n=1 Tax=Nocardioides taihuensis TaxID=1835606 RepID=A0ABW0BL01_9ACTN